MTDLKVFREKYQDLRRSRDTWYALAITRKLSVYFTLAFTKMGIHATAVSAVCMFTGIAAAAAFAVGGRSMLLGGALLLQLFYVLDHSDGEVARFFGETSLTGKYFDELIHYIAHSAAFLGLGWGLFRTTALAAHAIAGVLAAWSVIFLTLIVDLKNLMLLRNFHRAGDSGGFAYARAVQGSADAGQNFGKKVFSLLHAACHFQVFMNALTLAAVIDVLFGTLTTAAVFWFYAALMSVVWIAKALVFVTARRVDIDWERGNFK